MARGSTTVQQQPFNRNDRSAVENDDQKLDPKVNFAIFFEHIYLFYFSPNKKR
jgi:hypothetical protein